MKEIIKKLKIIITLIISNFLFVIHNTTYGLVNPTDYDPEIKSLKDPGKVVTIANTIIGGMQLFGSITSVVVLVIIGIKFVIGSVEEKAEYKESMQPYIIGAVMVFSISNLLGIISSIFS